MVREHVAVHWLGQVEYLAAWERQKVEAARTAQGERSSLLLLEHPPTYTLGRRGKLENLLLDAAARAQAGIAVHHVDRGGDITYHGPGQLVGYPILNLKRLQGRDTPDLVRYVRDLEQVLIDALAQWGVTGRRYPGYTGVWVMDAAGEWAKIAAIGVKVSAQGISSHGFALNVAPDLTHFDGIVPCGIREHGVTSLAVHTGRPHTVTSLLNAIQIAFANVFQVETTLVSAYNPLTVQVGAP